MTGSALSRLWGSRAGRAGCGLLGLMGLIAILSGTGFLASGALDPTDLQWAGPSSEHWLGTNRLGQDILDRAMLSTSTAVSIGVVVSFISVLLGALAGALAGWRCGGWMDEVMLWLTGVLDAIPIYLFAAALAFALGGGQLAMYLAMIMTFWTGTARLVRGEVMRLREREFVAAALAIGVPAPLIVLRHILPNTVNILLVQTALTFVAAIKTEVVLSFLGIGLQNGVSWGLMLAESTQDILAGHLGNFLGASTLMFALLLGLNLFSDALQDALDVREVLR